MAGTARKWFVGCGIGCGLIIIILGGVGTCGYFGIKRVVDKAEKLETGFEDLDEAYGDPQDFTPAPDGRIPADRMIVFLTVRERMTPARDEASAMFRTLDGDGPGGIVARIKAGIRFIPAMLEFIAQRNHVMLDEGMGVGEYQYIYALAYYAFLEKDPADGPGFTVSTDDDRDHSDGFRWEGGFGDEDEEDVRYRREKTVRRFVNRVQGQVMANQLEALEATEPGREDLVWLKQLAAEVRAMERERLRLPWEEGLPERIADSLAPYRTELEATYDPMTSVVEMGLVDHE